METVSIWINPIQNIYEKKKTCKGLDDSDMEVVHAGLRQFWTFIYSVWGRDGNGHSFRCWRKHPASTVCARHGPASTDAAKNRDTPSANRSNSAVTWPSSRTPTLQRKKPTPTTFSAVAATTFSAVAATTFSAVAPAMITINMPKQSPVASRLHTHKMKHYSHRKAPTILASFRLPSLINKLTLTRVGKPMWNKAVHSFCSNQNNSTTFLRFKQYIVTLLYYCITILLISLYYCITILLMSLYYCVIVLLMSLCDCVTVLLCDCFAVIIEVWVGMIGLAMVCVCWSGKLIRTIVAAVCGREHGFVVIGQ